LILQKLKEKYGYKLVKQDAFKFKEFLKNYSNIIGTNFYSADLKTIHKSDFVISIGAMLKNDLPNVRYAFNNSLKMNKGAGLYFHPLKDPVIEGLGKSIMTVAHAPLQEEAVLYLILDLFADKQKLPTEITKYLESFHSNKTITVTETIKEKVIEIVKEMKVNEETGEEEEVEVEKSKMVPKKVSKEVEVDDNRLLSILGIEDDFDAVFEKMMKKKDSFSMIVGPDLYNHPNSKNLARLVALIEKYSEFELVMIPTLTNTLGVSLINELSDKEGDFTIGYNTKGDFTLSALGDGDLDIPALNQQEGTFVNIDKNVVVLNVGASYNGYNLNDIANELGLKAKYTIDYTSKLGFEDIIFDDLDNYFDNVGNEYRGYKITPIVNEENVKLQEVTELGEYNGSVVYNRNPLSQFSTFTKDCQQINAKLDLVGSKQFAIAAKIKSGDTVKFSINGIEYIRHFNIDIHMKGTIAYNPVFDIDAKSSNYRYNQVKIEVING